MNPGTGLDSSGGLGGILPTGLYADIQDALWLQIVAGTACDASD